jgi:small subunit ribosomal protein S9
MADSYYGTGRRKEAVARVWLTEGTGVITVNERPLAQYVARPSLEAIVQAPFALTNTVGRFDVRATAKGGGISGQAGALRHGISRALVAFDANYRTVLRRLGLLTRDARIKERKKYGRKRARRGFQFSKR